MYSMRRNSRGHRSISRSAPGGTLDQIELERADPQGRAAAVRGTTKQGFYSCYELHDCKGLRKVIISTASQAPHPIVDGAERAQHRDRPGC
jgi:hypothetical protein